MVARGLAFVAYMVTAPSCARSTTPPGATRPPAAVDASVVRVSLGTSARVNLGASGRWRLVDRDGRVVTSGDSGQRVALSAARAAMRVSQPGVPDREVVALPLSFAPASARVFLTVSGRRYRGAITILAADTMVQVINHVDVEAYLRGVVPREIGVRPDDERAAVEAQAVAARSYVVARLGTVSRAFDVAATTADQVYGGVDAENAIADAAIQATTGLVLYYGDRIVSAQYYSACGGTTAEPSELWGARREPYFQRVSDRIAESDRFYCDIAPRFRWERSWRADTLAAVIERYVRSYAQAPREPLGEVRGVSVEGRTPSGRVAVLRLEMARGTYRVQRNDIRNVLRSPGGELLNSTYFSPEVVTGADGRLSRLTIRGLGYGHGVGMCQWGAIGRARAGQNFRTILRTYYPGTRLARAY